MKLLGLLRPHGRHRATPVAEFRLADLVPGTRWLACHNPRCAHTTTRHIPAGTGYRCTTCHTLKGAS